MDPQSETENIPGTSNRIHPPFFGPHILAKRKHFLSINIREITQETCQLFTDSETYTSLCQVSIKPQRKCNYFHKKQQKEENLTEFPILPYCNKWNKTLSNEIDLSSIQKKFKNTPPCLKWNRQLHRCLGNSMEDKPTEGVSNLSSSLSCSFLIDKFF